MQLSVHSQGAATSEDVNDDAVNETAVSDDDDGPPAGRPPHRVHEWLQQHAYNDQ